MRKVSLFRHAESRYNKKGLLQGQIDSKLSEKGLSQAEMLAKSLDGREFGKIYSSDLSRAVSTAEKIAEVQGAELVKRKELREADLGVLEGCSREELEYLGSEDEQEVFSPEGGESLREHVDRCFPVIEEASRSNAIVVTHSGTIKAVLSQISCNMEEVGEKAFRNCSETVICRRRGIGLLRKQVVL